MTTNIKIIIGAVVSTIVAIVLGHSVITTNTNSIPVATKGTSPEVSSQYFIVNGVSQWYYSTSIKNATTTPCAFQTPNATTTLERATIRITTGTSTATTWTIASSTTAYATTTIGTNFSVASGAKLSLAFAPQGSTQTDLSLLAPNSYVVVGVAGTAIGSDTVLRGSCELKLLQL